MAIWRPWVRCGMWIPAAASHRKHCTAYCACWGVTDPPVHLRGYVEALGTGIHVRPDDLLLRGSCYTLDGEGCCTMPCCAPAKVEDPAFTYYRLGGYQALLVFPHMAHTVNNIVTQIPSGGQRALCPQGSLVLRHAFERLLTKERCMLLWGQSVPVALPPFPQKSAVICGKELVKGIARLLHMELFPVKGATGDVDNGSGRQDRGSPASGGTLPLCAAAYQRGG